MQSSAVPTFYPIYLRAARTAQVLRPPAGLSANQQDWPGGETSLIAARLDDLRAMVRRNQVSFPSQIPVFEKHDRCDLQPKLVQLFFLFGWSSRRIAARYKMLPQRVVQILNTWRRRAVEMGYVQEIPPARKPAQTSEEPIQVIFSHVIRS
jgi:hypothetical protein